MSNSSQINVLSLPSWYPDNVDPTNGLFLKKHTESVAHHVHMTALYVAADPTLHQQTFKIKKATENGVFTVEVFYRISDLENNANRLIRFYRYIQAARYGWHVVRQKIGLPDIVHVHVAHPAGRIALFLKEYFNIPYLVSEQWTGYTPFNDEFYRMPWYNRWGIQQIYKNASAVTTVSHFLKKALQQKRLTEVPTKVVPNIVDSPGKPLSPSKNNTPLKALTISDLRDPQKNISGLLKAVKQLVLQFPNFELHHVGVGPDADKLQRKARQLGLYNKHVYFHGYIPNQKLQTFFQESHFFVLNSRYETFSVVTAEALAHGVPVLVTKCGAPEEYVTKDVGKLVPRENPEALQEGLRYMCQHWHEFDPAQLRSHVKQRFSREAVGRQFLNLYEKVLQS
jgi:glycosyltransferase involved in cell wall biosynthesis